MGQRPPADLDKEGKKKFKELIALVDPDIDIDLVANYCRMHSSLMAIREERARQLKAGTYKALVPGRDKSLQLNPLQTAENRMVNALGKMLRSLGLGTQREEQERRKKKRLPSPAPPGFEGLAEPPWGWELEMALCGPLPSEEDKQSKKEKTQ